MWTFFITKIVLFILIWAFVGTGAVVSDMHFIDGPDTPLDFIEDGYIGEVVFFTIFFLLMFFFGICILFKKCSKCNNAAVCIYAVLMFFLGFIPMAAQSGALIAIEGVDIA